MLRVLIKVRTFVNGATRAAGEEITILDHHFSDEVHTILEDLGVDEKPVGNPVIPGRVPLEASTPEPPKGPPPVLEPEPTPPVPAFEPISAKEPPLAPKSAKEKSP